MYAEVEGRVGQLAVRGLPGEPDPQLVGAPALEAVRDASGRTWWIEKGAWDRSKRYHAAPTVNRAGAVEFVVGAQTVRVDVVPRALSDADFDAMVAEFRNGMWGLIMDRASGTTATKLRGAGQASEAFAEAVRDLAERARRALALPHADLREATVWTRPERARPSVKTYQERARRGAPRLLPGRGHIPTHDTPENRALATMVARTERAVRAAERAARARASDFLRRSRYAEARLEALDANPGHAWLDADRLKRDLDDVRARSERWAASMQRLSERGKTGGDGPRVRRKLRVGSSWVYPNGKPWSPYYSWGTICQVETSVVTGGSKRIKLRLRFRDVSQEDVTRVFAEGQRLELRGRLREAKPREETDRSETYTYWVEELEPLADPSRDEIRSLTGLLAATVVGPDGSEGAWRRLRDDELEDEERARTSHLADAARMEKARADWEGVADDMAGLGDLLRRVLRRCDDLDVEPDQRVSAVASGSMVYVHNAQYRGALGAYRRIEEESALTEGDVDLLFALDDVGLLDLPTVFERWCLVRLLRSLTEDLGFVWTGEGSLVSALASPAALAAVGKQRVLCLALERPGDQRSLEVEYQPRIQVGAGWRTPDYVVTLRGPEEGSRRMVLDAKLKPFRSLYGGSGSFALPSEIGHLLGKGYGAEGRDRVFVLHPGGTGPPDGYTALGGEPVEGDASLRADWDREREGDSDRLDHDVGAVALRPGVDMPLRRLFLLHLLEGVDDRPVSRERDPLGFEHLTPPTLPPFCPSCGGTGTSATTVYGSYKGKRYPARTVYRCTTRACGHEWIRTRCVSCKRELWKLGVGYTYHSTRPMDPYDVKCPNCAHYAPINISHSHVSP